MRIGLSLLSGRSLPLVPGVPNNYQGTLLRNAHTQYASAGFGTVVVQQVQMSAMSLVVVHVHWTRPERLVCEHHDQCTLFTRATLATSLHHFIKGTGEIHLKKEQFMTLAAGSWRSVILPEKPGYHTFVDISWSPRFISEMLDTNHLLSEALKNANCDGFPESLLGVPLDMDKQMKRLLGELFNFDCADRRSENLLRKNLAQYFISMTGEAITRESIRKKLRPSDWHTVHAARELIDANLLAHLTIPDISAKGQVDYN